MASSVEPHGVFSLGGFGGWVARPHEAHKRATTARQPTRQDLSWESMVGEEEEDGWVILHQMLLVDCNTLRLSL